MKKIIIPALLLGLLGFTSILLKHTNSAQATAPSCQHNPVQLCHSTGSNHYNTITVDDDAVFQNGHDHHQNGQDIIPPFSYKIYEIISSVCPTSNSAYTSHSHKACSRWLDHDWHYADKIDTYGCVDHNFGGKNWDSDGQAIWNNGCITPHPTESCQPTPTPTEECNPTPTEEPECTPTPTEVPEGTPSPTPEMSLTPTPTTGENQGGGGDNVGGGGGGSGQPYVCSDEKPGTPTLLTANRTSGKTLFLKWTAADKATTYAISYGIKLGEYIYGVVDTGNVTEYTIGDLDPGQTYFAIVRAINGCMPGDPSTGIGGGEVLGATTLAATGTADETLAWYVIVGGAVLSLLSLYGWKKAKITA